MIPLGTPDRVILVDACLSGLRATDGQYDYGPQIAPVDHAPFHITDLEAMNVVLAVHTFVRDGNLLYLSGIRRL